ncbi:MAG: CPBP family intramembrane metalloprotease [Anaerolineales bacterium]|jgi:membrane protease YdiL (CAAX protease family)
MSNVPERSRSNLPFVLILVGVYLYPLLLFTLVNKFAREATGLQYFLTIGSSILLSTLAIWAMRHGRFSLQDAGVSLRKAIEAVFLLCVVWCVYGIILTLFGAQNLLQGSTDPSQLLQQWLFVGIAEELLFRGYLLERIRSYFQMAPRWVATLSAAAISSAIFATWHIPVRLFRGFQARELWSSLLQLFVLGLIFSYLYLRPKSILFAGLLHGSWNVPLFGTQGDYMLMIVALLVVETYLLFKKFIPLQANNSQEDVQSLTQN